MTRILVPAPPIEADVSAAQVTAYLLARGWRYAGLDTEQCWQVFKLGRKRVELPVDLKMRRRASMLASIIDDIARAERRHPSAVLADIVGPSVGVAGRVCQEDGRDIARAMCKFRMALARKVAETAERAASRVDVETDDDDAHGAEESEAR